MPHNDFASRASQSEILAYRSLPDHGDFGSAALKNILEKLDSWQSRVSVLDLGGCKDNILRRFATHGIGLTCEELPEQLRGINSINSVAEPPLSLSSYLSFTPLESSFDLILIWDLLSYLELPRLQELFRNLAECSHAETSVHALLSTLTRMPSTPGKFSLELPEAGKPKISYDLKQNSSRSCPRHSPRDIERLAPEFRIESLVLLKNGFYELTLVLR